MDSPESSSGLLPERMKKIRESKESKRVRERKGNKKD